MTATPDGVVYLIDSGACLRIAIDGSVSYGPRGRDRREETARPRHGPPLPGRSSWLRLRQSIDVSASPKSGSVLEVKPDGSTAHRRPLAPAVGRLRRHRSTPPGQSVAAPRHPRSARSACGGSTKDGKEAWVYLRRPSTVRRWTNRRAEPYSSPCGSPKRPSQAESFSFRAPTPPPPAGVLDGGPDLTVQGADSGASRREAPCPTGMRPPIPNARWSGGRFSRKTGGFSTAPGTRGRGRFTQSEPLAS